MNIMIIGKGRMGKLIAETAARRENMNVILMADRLTHPDLSDFDGDTDVVIDFSHPDNLDWITDYIKKKKCAYVCGTTGYTDAQSEQIRALSSLVPVVFQSNFSLGIAVLKEVLELITPILENDFDIEVIEKHHNQKQDAPSGTAKMLLETLNKNNTYSEVHGRNGFIGKRGKEIGVHAVRGGTLAGEHSVLFLGDNESLEIKHNAESRQIFASGAITAARFAAGKAPGLYTMKDILFG